METKGKVQGSVSLCGALVLLIFLFSHFDLVFAQWEDAQITRLTQNEFRNHLRSLTIDRDDKLFLIYKQNTTHVAGGPYKIFLMTKESGQDWSEPEEIGDTSCHLGQGCDYSVTIDPETEVIHLLYYGTDKIYYSNNQRENWEKDLIDSGYTYSGKLAFDSLGNVHLSLGKQWVSAGEHYVKYYYVTKVSGEWVQQAISPDIFTGPYGYAAVHSIEAEREGVVHIVYAGSYYYKHAWNNTLGGTTWTTRYIPPPEVSEWYGIVDFKIDKDDQLHALVYASTPSRGYVFHYHKLISDSLFTQGEEIYNLGDPSWLFIDKEGDVHACGWRPGGIYYSNNTSGSWKDVSQILDHTEYYSNLPFAFVVDSEGNGHVVFEGYYYPHGLEPDSSEIYYMVGSPTAAPEAEEPVEVADFILLQNYPNPFNTTTLIPFRVNGKQSTVNGPVPTTQRSVNSSKLMVHGPLHTTLVIYNILGEKVRTLVDEEKLPGEYRVMWDGKDETRKEVASGVYFYKLKLGDLAYSNKLVLIK